MPPGKVIWRVLNKPIVSSWGETSLLCPFFWSIGLNMSARKLNTVRKRICMNIFSKERITNFILYKKIILLSVTKSQCEGRRNPLWAHDYQLRRLRRSAMPAAIENWCRLLPPPTTPRRRKPSRRIQLLLEVFSFSPLLLLLLTTLLVLLLEERAEQDNQPHRIELYECQDRPTCGRLTPIDEVHSCVCVCVRAD